MFNSSINMMYQFMSTLQLSTDPHARDLISENWTDEQNTVLQQLLFAFKEKDRAAILKKFRRLDVDQTLRAPKEAQMSSFMNAVDEISRWTKQTLKALTFYALEHGDEIPQEIKDSEVYKQLFAKIVIDQV